MCSLRRVETESRSLRTLYLSLPLFCVRRGSYAHYTQEFALTRPLFEYLSTLFRTKLRDIQRNAGKETLREGFESLARCRLTADHTFVPPNDPRSRPARLHVARHRRTTNLVPRAFSGLVVGPEKALGTRLEDNQRGNAIAGIFP